MEEMLTMMKELTDAPGVPGQEEAVRRVMRRYLEPLGEVMTDNLGSIVGRKVGQLSRFFMELARFYNPHLSGCFDCAAAQRAQHDKVVLGWDCLQRLGNLVV